MRVYIIVAAILLISVPTFGDDILYKWKEKDGSIGYGNNPPSDTIIIRSKELYNSGNHNKNKDGV
jgi:hypothetical protein